jgi:uncharacterized membrane protein YgcG
MLSPRRTLPRRAAVARPATTAAARALATLSAAAAITLAGAGPALAASVARTDNGTFTGLSAVDGNAESNVMTLEVPAAGFFHYRDTGAPLRAEAGCAAFQGGAFVECPVAASQKTIAFSAVLGGGNDIAVARAVPAAQPGSVTVTLAGGPGNDRLTSEGPATTFFAGDGDDHLRPGPGADQVSGEGGTGDTVDYGARRAAVTLDLALDTPIAGALGEGDRVRDVEHAITGSGADRISGSSAANTIDPGAGGDSVSTLGGADTVDARDGVRDAIGCGSGADTVFADWVDTVSADCETVTRSGLRPGPGGFGTPDREPQPPAPEFGNGNGSGGRGGNGGSGDDGGLGGGSGGGGSAPGGSAPGGSPGGTPGAGAPAGPDGRDHTAPTLTRVAFAPATFRARGGTRLRYRLSEPATLRIRIERTAPGRRAGRRCVAPSARLKRTGARRCTRARTVAQMTRTGGAAGLRTTALGARLGRVTLRPGSYRAVVVARDAAGNASRAAVARFRIRR